MKHSITKSYIGGQALSCCFRQPRAESHCAFLHGYALGFEIVLESEELNSKNWVFDFGGFKSIYSWLKANFDHRTLVALDDPEMEIFQLLDKKRMIDLNVLEKGVGCEAFAEYVGAYLVNNLPETVQVKSVTVSEHSANSATFTPTY